MTDNYYTPKALAQDLVACCNLPNPRRIADFAVGEGSLLSAAHRAWPTAKLYGIDVDLKAIQKTKTMHPKAKFYNVDFLSRDGSGQTKSLNGKIDLIILNPPFSCLSSSYETTTFGSDDIKSSKAMAFVLKSCQYLSSTGEILAIVPRSFLLSQKDQNARTALLKSYSLDDLGPYHSPGFNGASVSVHLVRISKTLTRENDSDCSKALERLKPNRKYDVAIMRGTHPVALGELNINAPSLIHTTDLFNGEVSVSRRRAVKKNKQISGPVVMMPRVARPNKNKIVVGNFVQSVVPSDCIISAKTIPAGNEVHLQGQLLRFWPALKNTYSGTCASYLTLNALKELLVSLGYRVEINNDPSFWNPVEDEEIGNVYNLVEI